MTVPYIDMYSKFVVCCALVTLLVSDCHKRIWQLSSNSIRVSFFFNFPLFSVQNKRIYIINFFPKIDYFVIITTVFFSNKTNNLLIRVCLVNWVGIYGTYIYKVEGWSTIYPSNICLIILNVIILAISHIFLRGKLKYFRFQIWLFFLFSLYAEFFSQRRPIQTEKWPRPPSLLKGRNILEVKNFITVVIVGR